MIAAQYYPLVAIAALSILVDLTVLLLSWHSYRTSGFKLERTSAQPALKRRVAAYTLDLLIVLALALALSSTFGPAAGLAWPLLMIVVGLIYPLLCYRFTRLTLGQRLAGLQRPMPDALSDVAVAWAVLGFMFMLFGFPFGFLSILVDGQRRCVEERISGLAFQVGGAQAKN